MTYPAWFDLHRDHIITRRPVAMQVYASLVSDQRGFFEPRECKVWAMAELLHVQPNSVVAALNLLVERGYLLEHDRTDNNVRRFTIAFQRGISPNHDASVA